MTIEVTLPDGSIAEFPDGTSEEEMLNAISPKETSTPVFAAQKFNEGLAQVLGLPVDIVNSALSVVGAGTDKPVGGSKQLTETLESVGAAGAQPANRTQEFVGRVSEEVGASAIPAGATLRGAQALTRAASPVLKEIGEQATRAPGRFAATEGGLAVTSGAGAATAEQVAPGNETAELVGQIAGGVGPAVASSAVRGALRGTNREALEESVEEFSTAGASPSVGQATSNRALQALENVLGALPGGGGVIFRFAAETQEKIGRRVNQIASQLGATSSEQAGKSIERGLLGADGFVARFKGTSKRLFDRVNEFIPGETRVSVKNSLDRLNELSSIAPGAEETSALLVNPKIRGISQAFTNDAADGTLPYEAVKRIRTQVGDLLASPEIIADAPRSQLKQLYGALTEDMKAAAIQAGPEALKAFNRANRFYSAGLDRLDDQLRTITSKLARDGVTPEQVFRAALSGSQEGASILRPLRKSLNQKEWNVLAGTVLQRLGRAVSSQQDELGEVFSVETFLTNWNKLSTDAKDILFSGGTMTPLKNDLDKIAGATSSIREGSRVLANPSGTAARAANIGSAGFAAGSILSGNTVIPIALATTALSANLGARLMTNPKFVKWLAQGTEIPVSRLPAHITRLANTLGQDPEYNEAVQELIGIFSNPELRQNQDTGQIPQQPAQQAASQ